MRELAANIFRYLKQWEVYSREDKFKNSKGWLEKYFRRNPDIEAMVISARKEAEVKPWMLKYTDVWLFLLNRVIDPAYFDELPLRIQKELRREKKQTVAKKVRKQNKKGFIQVRGSSNMPRSELEERDMDRAMSDIESQQGSASEDSGSQRSDSEEYLDSDMLRMKREMDGEMKD